jgi:3-oxoacyl-[acyl-carrier-protein] synthase III
LISVADTGYRYNVELLYRRRTRRISRLHAFIESVGAYVPKRIITNAELAESIDTSDEWIFSHTGIHKRHVAAEDETTSDMAAHAANSALERANVSAKDIDLILLATSTPDYQGFPSTSAIVQHKIHAKKAGAMDLVAACTGFIYGLETARVFIESGSAKRVLVIGVEAYSRILDWTDRNTCVLFGDAAGAALVSAATDSTCSKIVTGTLSAMGEGAEHLYLDKVIHMNGRRVYNFAVKALCDTVEELLEAEDDAREHIAAIVPHQANVRIIDAAGKRLGFDNALFYKNMDQYANTGSASIPLALNEMCERELLTRGDLILTIGFGGGLTHGGNLIYW